VPVMAVRRAERNNEQITVVGKLQMGLEIELDWIEYEGQIIDTDFKPPEFRPSFSYGSLPSIK
jgi:hypothetical protein